MKQWIAERLRRGELPEWNAREGLGVPVIATAVDAVLHPYTLLTTVLPFEAGFRAWVLLSCVAAALGACAWARRLGASWTGAVAAGLAYGLSGPIISATDNLTYLTAAASLPWGFAAVHAYAEKGGPGRLASVAFAVALCAAAGDPQAWLFQVALLVPYALGVTWRTPHVTRRVAIARAMAAPVAAAVASLPFVLPVALWTPHSSRADPLGSLERDTWNLVPARLAELVVPNLVREPNGAISSPLFDAIGTGIAGMPWSASIYFGVATVALALIAAGRCRRARLLLAVAVASAWLSMGPNTFLGSGIAATPVIGQFRYWEKMLVWTALALAAAAGLGVDTLRRRPESHRASARALALGTGTLLAALAALSAWPALVDHLSATALSPSTAARLTENARGGLGLAAVVLGTLAWWIAAGHRRREAVFAGGLATILAVDLLVANSAGYTLCRSTAATAQSALGASLARHPGLQRTYGPFSMHPTRWQEASPMEGLLLWGGRTLAPPWNLRVQNVGAFEIYGALPPLRFTHLRNELSQAGAPVLGFWSVAHLVVPQSPELAAKAGLAPPFQVEAEDSGLPAFLVAVPYRPRAYVAGEPFTATEQEALAFVLREDPMRTPRTAVEAPVPPDAAGARGVARIATDEPEHVVIEVESDRRALLVLNDQFAPGWTARVDGTPSEILAANYLARGVWVPAGVHRVEFRYRTPGLREGAAAALLLAVFLAGWAGWERRARGR